MPRINYINVSDSDQLTPQVMNSIGADMDVLFSQGSDRGRVYLAVSEIALKVDVGTFAYNISGVQGVSSGATNLAVANHATIPVLSYVQVNSGGTIESVTDGWDDEQGRLAIVTAVAGAITSIVNYKADVVGGAMGGGGGFDTLADPVYNKIGKLASVTLDEIEWTYSYDSNGIIKSRTNGSVTYNYVTDAYGRILSSFLT